MALLNDVQFMNSAGPLALPATGTVRTVKTYTGLPGNPSPGVALDNARRFGITATVTGSAVGSLQLEASNDNVNFANLGSAVAVAAAGTYLIAGDADFKYVRLAYTATSGTGTLASRLKRTNS